MANVPRVCEETLRGPGSSGVSSAPRLREQAEACIVEHFRTSTAPFHLRRVAEDPVFWSAIGRERRATEERMTFCAAILLGAFILQIACGAAWAQVLDFAAIEAMIRRGEAGAAYALLEPHEYNYAGDADFDYLFGVAALDSGHPARARAALERLLLNHPDFAGARLNLARAYFALGDKHRARAEFMAVLATDPPQATRDTIANFLATIDQEPVVPRNRVAGYLEGAVGRDTNINLATTQDQVYVPLFGINFLLAPTSVALRDNYWSLAGGVAGERVLSDRFTAFGGIGIKLRENVKNGLYDGEDYEARGGVQLAQGPHLARLGLVGDRYYLDKSRYRNIDGVLGEWRHQHDANNQASLFVQESRIRYLQPGAQSYSGNQSIIGGGWVRSFDETGRSYAFAGVYGGRDRATENREDGDKAIVGMRVAGQWGISERSEWFAYASAASGRYDQVNPGYLVKRHDWQYDAGVGLNWRFAPAWTLRPQLAFTRNNSNIELYDYNRYDTSVTLRRDFR